MGRSLSEEAVNRIESIEAIVKDQFDNAVEVNPHVRDEATYRWLHTLRVTNYGFEIARAEKADPEIVIAACLLHDMAHFAEGEYRDHGREASRRSRPILHRLGYSAKTVDAICYAVAVHVDGEAGFDHPDTLESQVVSDADNIDRFGPYRLIQFAGERLSDYDELLAYAKKRAEVLLGYVRDNPMDTDTGRTMFAEQVKRQKAFYEAVIEQYDRTRLPDLSA